MEVIVEGLVRRQEIISGVCIHICRRRGFRSRAATGGPIVPIASYSQGGGLSKGKLCGIMFFRQTLEPPFPFRRPTPPCSDRSVPDA